MTFTTPSPRRIIIASLSHHTPNSPQPRSLTICSTHKQSFHHLAPAPPILPSLPNPLHARHLRRNHLRGYLLRIRLRRFRILCVDRGARPRVVCHLFDHHVRLPSTRLVYQADIVCVIGPPDLLVLSLLSMVTSTTKLWTFVRLCARAVT